MIRILFFAFRKPYPLDDGSALRTYNICKSLTERGNRVFLAYFNQKEEHLTSDEDIINKVVEETLLLKFPDFYDQIYGKLYKILLSLHPFSHIPFKPRGISTIQGNLKNFIETHNIDIIHLRDSTTGLSLIDFHETSKLLDLTDSMSLALKREMREEKDFRKKMWSYLLYNWCRGIEKTLLKDSDIATVVSPADKEMLKSLYRKASIEVIPNGVDINYFSPKDRVDEEYPCVLFHGTMAFLPNIQAVKYIYNEIFPIIKSKVPETKFLIVGSNPVDEIKSLGNRKGVIVTGYVDDIREYISKASVVLVPMKSGCGIKNKILEAMAMEKPVVTNPMGAEALSEEAKKCLLIEETADEIANHVINLLRDGEKRIELGKKGREIVMEEYTWDKVAEKYEKLYMELIKSK